MKFTDNDIKLINSLGIKKEQVKTQLDRFINGFPDMQLSKIVTNGNGVIKLSDDMVQSYISIFNEKGPDKRVVKFVPASGAASRMFKLLYNYIDNTVSLENDGMQEYFKGIGKFAFSQELVDLLKDKDIENLVANGDKQLVELLLSEEGLNYGMLPKALITFHEYEKGETTKAIDEHLVEGAKYCCDANNNVYLHFTVSEEHQSLIEAHLSNVVPQYESRFKVKYDISFSIQDTATNTLAVDLENNPFRTSDGNLLFRPGGHGALLNNLDKIEADIAFIKNIDNVAASWLINDTVTYKKVLGGVLTDIQDTIFAFCTDIDSEKELSAEFETKVISFLSNSLGFNVSDEYSSLSNNDKKEYLLNKLNRPTRVCGVVEASGTGGGPFWVRHNDGAESLQLVETAQISDTDNSQLEILNNSNYANITDLACGLRNYKGENFNLANYSDPDTGFIAVKSLGADSLKAMELPGLWNGAMSDWNTHFVVVPMTTFNPVKTVLDLLKKEHQGR